MAATRYRLHSRLRSTRGDVPGTAQTATDSRAANPHTPDASTRGNAALARQVEGPTPVVSMPPLRVCIHDSNSATARNLTDEAIDRDTAPNDQERGDPAEGIPVQDGGEETASDDEPEDGREDGEEEGREQGREQGEQRGEQGSEQDEDVHPRRGAVSHTREGRQRSGNQEEQEREDTLAQLEIGGLQLMAPPALMPETLFSSFDAASQLSRGELEKTLNESPAVTAALQQSAPAPDDNGEDKQQQSAAKQTRQEIHQALERAGREYSNTHYYISYQHDQLISSRNNAAQRLALAYDSAVQQTLTSFYQCDDNIGQAFRLAETSMANAAADADRSIVRDYRQARRQLFGTAAWARGAVGNNARTAQSQISDIITELSASYTGYLDRASKDCESEGNTAHTNTTNWKNNLATEYPNSGGGMQRAENEAKRLAGSAGADRVLPDITQGIADIKRDFAASKTQVIADVRNAVYPSLNQRAQAIGTEGVEAVKTAFNTALSGLKQQMRDARKRVRQMHTQAQEQLRAQRLAARAQLEGSAAQALQSLNAQTLSATSGLIGSARKLAPNYADAARQLADSLTHAARGGPQALIATAEQAAPAVREQIDRAALLANEQGDAIISGAESGIQQQLQQDAISLAEEYASTSNQLNASSMTTTATLNDAAERMTAGFSSVADQVAATAQNWAMPLADVFAEFLSNQTKALEEGLPAFKGRVDSQKDEFVGMVKPLQTPATKFAPALTTAWPQIRSKITTAKESLGAAFSAGIFDRIDEGGATSAVRGLTAAQGDALRSIWPTTPPQDMVMAVQAYHDYSGDMTYNLDIHLAIALDVGSDDYNAAINYLNGNTAEGARYELEASMHWYNDEEDRIEATMRSLTDEQRKQLHDIEGWSDTAEDVRDALDGTDLNVFNALDEGNHARADLYRMLDRVEEARTSSGGGYGDNDQLNDVLAEYSRGVGAEQWGGEAVSGEERRRQIQAEFAELRGIDLEAIQAGNEDINSTEEAAAQALFEHITRDIDVQRSSGEHSYTVTLKVEGAPRDLARALIFQGEGSPEARAATLGVETQRRGGPNIVNVDEALVDPRLNPNLVYDEPNEQTRARMREEALADRRRVMEIFARNYGGGAVNGEEAYEQNRETVAHSLETAFGNDELGAQLSRALVEEDHPSPATSAMAMDYAIDGAGTNNELIDRVMPRMNRDEIAEMRADYKEQTGNELYDDLGVHGHGWFGDLSGDDRLRFERQSLGRPRNDCERAEVAAFTIQQQRNETGWLGSALASGSIQDQFLTDAEVELAQQLGGSVSFGEDGAPQWDSPGNFNEAGEFQGDAAEFQASLLAARLSSENYAAKIDQYANAASMGIAIAGAVVAAVATVFTGGAASPLLLAAIVGISGLAAMGTQRLISGGRYGWEQASIDLGMTAVQALTAGVGQSLALASRGGVAGMQAGMRAGLSISAARQVANGPLLGQMGRLTGNAFMDKLVIGMIGGGLGSLGQTALDERTWAKGGAHATDELFAGLFRGILSGGVTAGVSNALEDLPLQRVLGLSRIFGNRTLGDTVGQSTSMVGRGLGKGLSSSLGGAAGRGAELSFDKARGAYRGDAGDIFQAMGEAGLQQAFQGVIEGSTEARAQAIFNRRQALATQGIGAEPDSPARTPRPVAEAATETPETAATPRPGIDHDALQRVSAAEPEAQTTVPRPSGQAAEDALTEHTARPRATTEADTERATAGKAGVTADAEEHTPLPKAAGAAARVADSEMRLATNLVIHDPQAALSSALQHLDGLDSALLNITPVANQSGPERLVDITLADGRKMRVRIEVGTTDESHIASFRPAGEGADESFVVTLSNRAPETTHARALAHELAELSVHRLPAHAAEADLLSNRAPTEIASPALSAHDRGRLAELEVLGSQLKAIPPDSTDAGAQRNRQRLQREIDALGAHLGLLHSDASDPRLLAVLDQLPETSPARTALDESRQRAREASLEDTLVPARRVADDASLSAADRARLAQLDELGTAIRDARQEGFRSAPEGSTRATSDYGPEETDAALAASREGRNINRPAQADDPDAVRVTRQEPATVQALEMEFEQLARSLGLLDTDSATTRRVDIALRALEVDSAGAEALGRARAKTARRQADMEALQQERANVERRRTRLEAIEQLQQSGGGAVIVRRPNRHSSEIVTRLGEGDNDALRPGLKPDERTVLSARDLANIERLRTRVEAVEQLRQSDASASDIARARLAAESLATAMGLVHGGDAASARAALTRSALGDSEPLRGAFDQVLAGAEKSPLLQPRQGTVEDLPLLAAQVEQARAMGDIELATRLVEIAGMRLEEVGLLALADSDATQVKPRLDQLAGNDTRARALIEDAMQRKSAQQASTRLQDEADSVRRSLFEAENRVAAARADAVPERGQARPAKERIRDQIEAAQLPEIERLRIRLQELTSNAEQLARAAHRSHGTDMDSAMATRPGDPDFPNVPRLRTDPDFPGNPEQQRLTRQLYGDSPEFQTWEQFRELYYRLNPSVREHQQGLQIGATGEIKAYGADELARIFGYWRGGQYIDPETGATRGLGGLQRIRAKGKTSVYDDNTPAPTVAADKEVAIRVDRSSAEVSNAARQRREARATGRILVSEAEGQRRAARAERRDLAAELAQAKTPQEQQRLKAQIKRIDLEIIDLSEALGVAAGRRFGSTLVNESELQELNGAGVPDLVHVDESSGRVIAIECKGGESDLCERRATSGGRTVMAEQASPQYLRSLANDMVGSDNADKQALGRAILEALDKKPPNIEMYVVRQPFGDNDQLRPIEVSRYQINNDGR